MKEPYHIEKDRIRQELIEAHRPYRFYESDRFRGLYHELMEAHEVMDVELGIDILADIETAKKNFNKSLPWWYRDRWNCSPIDVEAYLTAKAEYDKRMYKGGGVMYLISDLVLMIEINS